MRRTWILRGFGHCKIERKGSDNKVSHLIEQMANFYFQNKFRLIYTNISLSLSYTMCSRCMCIAQLRYIL